MMAKQDEILAAIKALTTKLYGENGFEGDITEIKKHLKQLNGNVNRNTEHIAISDATLYGHGNNNGLVKQVAELMNKYWKLTLVIATISGLVGGGIGGLVNIFG
jgi:hypothetical protein